MIRLDRNRSRVAIAGGLALVAWLPLGALGAEKRLIEAVEQRDLSTVKSLLEQGVDANESQADGMTALHWAAYLDDVDAARVLLEQGADASQKTQYGVMPLSLACKNGNEAMVRLLLKHGADPNASLRGEETVLMTAARTGRVGPVKALLAKGAEVNASEKKGQTATMWAAAEGHADIVDVLIEAGADFRISLPSGFDALMFAVRQGHGDVVQRLLAAGVDVNQAVAPDPSHRGSELDKGMSPLMLAIENGHFQLAADLLEAGADANDVGTGFSPLHAISWVRKPAIGDNEYGDPPPIGSGKLTSLELVDVLVQHGADVNVQKKNNGKRGKFGKKNSTPFLLAAGTADIPLMEKLLEHGADPTLRNAMQWTPLMMAAGIGSGPEGDEPGTKEEALQAVNFLLDLGADVNALDRDSETAMHGAAYKMAPEIVHCLDARGADIAIWSKPSEKGRTPLSIAQGYRPGNFKPSFETVDAIKEVMLAHGVTPPPPPREHEGNYVD